MVNYSLHLGLHLNLLRNGKKLTETGIHWFDVLTRGIFFNTRWTKFVSPCDNVISSMLKNATVRILTPSQPFLGSSRDAPLPKRLLSFESHCWRGVLRDDRPWKRLLAHPIPQALAALFFFFHDNFKQHPGTNIQEAVHSTDFQHTQPRSQYKTGKDNDGLHTYEVLQKILSFLLLTKSQQSITKQRKSRKIARCKKCNCVVNFALPRNILEFLHSQKRSKLHHDGAVTFTVALTSWKIEYYGKVTFASSRGGGCVISFEQRKNDGAFLAKFKKSYESRSQCEVGNCCCILSQKCKLTFYLLISQSLSMFWRCSRAATIAVGIWLETIADLFARFWDFRGS